MAKKKIGLIYSNNKEWIAGSYYILNLVHALNTQRDEVKPKLIILSNSYEEFLTIKRTGYPYLQFHQLNKKKLPLNLFAERGINKLARMVGIKKNIFDEKLNKQLRKKHIDLVFPATKNSYFSSVRSKLFWIPDFQEHFLPQFFSEQELEKRKAEQTQLVADKEVIVFSSKDALSHFKKIYPFSKSPTFVLPFAVTHPPYKHLSIDDLLKKYDLFLPYFFCANQFWAHKNHLVILKAIKILKDNGITNFVVAFSGKETDYRNPHFFATLKQKVAEWELEKMTRFLGFIERDEQLQLMNYASCIIQPSMFEGWSTVVEDAKAMNQYVILSDLKVHREQLTENVSFFNPDEQQELADLMQQVLMNKPDRRKIDYEMQIKIFGEKFIKIIDALD